MYFPSPLKLGHEEGGGIGFKLNAFNTDVTDALYTSTEENVIQPAMQDVCDRSSPISAFRCQPCNDRIEITLVTDNATRRGANLAVTFYPQCRR